MGITTNEILIPQRTFRAKVEKDLEFDTTLTDYCPDVARIIRVDCTPFAESCSFENDKATVNGKAVYDVLYETDYKNRLKYCSFTQEFSQTIPVRTAGENASVICNVKCERIGCKLLSPRRLIIKATLGAEFEIEGEKALSALAVNRDEDTFFKSKEVEFEGKATLLEQSFRFGESVALLQHEKSVGDVVCASVSLQEPQISILDGKAEIKSVATVRALCEEESNEGSYFVSQKSLPISFEIQNGLISESKRASAMILPTDVTVTPELDQYGESRVLKADFGVNLTLKLNEQRQCSVAEDMFERDYRSELVFDEVALPQLALQTEISFTAESKISDITPRQEAILDCYVRENGVSAEKTEGGINLSGSFVITCLTSSSDGIYSFDELIPYSQFLQAELPNGDFVATAQSYPIESVATLNSDGSISARVIAGARVKILTEKRERIASGIKDRERIEKNTDECAMIYCFPASDETVWDIAKAYHVNPERIESANPDGFDECGKALGASKPILIKA